MNNRALIGLSAAAMSALVATAVGCGEPQQKTYTPAEEPAATVEAPATTEAETTETEAAEPETAEADKAEETTEAEGEKAEQAAPAEDAKAEEKAEPAAEETKAEETTEAEGDKAADEEKAEEAAPAAEAGALTDGSYTAEGKGIGGKVPVTVTVKDGKVSDVKVGDNSETQGIGSKAIEQLPDAIVAANGTEGVDAVSGATVTSKAIFTAVDEALEQAKVGAAEGAAAEETKTEEAAPAEDAKADDKAAADEAAPAAEAGSLKDGSYTASGKGIGGKVPVTVIVRYGKIFSVEVGDNSETQGIGSKAIEQLPDAIVEANGTEGVDAVSGASVTSKAIFTAVEDCLNQAKGGTDAAAATTMADGEYTASAKGIGGDVPVTVTVKDGKIAKVEVGENSETQGIGSKAIEQLPDEIVKANGTEGVDAVSGASVTSKAIFDAVNDCMDQAKKAAGTTDDKAAADKDAKADTTKADETKDAKAADTKDEKASDTKDAAATDKAAEATTEAKAETK